MAKRSISKINGTLKGTNAADNLTVKGKHNTVYAKKGKDRITLSKGSGHKIYGESGNDTITIGKTAGSGNRIYGDDAKNKTAGHDKIVINGGNNQYIYGGKGNDTITINGGNNHYIFGGQGFDTFAIGKKFAGTVTIKDFGSELRNNADTLKIIGNTISKTKISKQNIIVTAGKSTIKLENTKGRKIFVQDSRGDYMMSDTAVELYGNFKGSVNTSTFSPTLKSLSGTERNDTITVSSGSNTKVFTRGGDDTVFVTKGNGHIVDTDKGHDTVTISGGQEVEVFTDIGNDKIIVNGGSAHSINSGSGNDEIFINAGSDHFVVRQMNYDPIYGNEYVEIGKNAGDNIHILSFNNSMHGDETIVVNGGNKHWIQLANDGKQNVTVNNGNDTEVRLSGGVEPAAVTVNGGKNCEIVCSGSNVEATYEINVLKGEGHSVKMEHYVNDFSNNANIVIAAKNVTLDLGNQLGSNNVTVQWSNNIGKLYIEAYKDFESSGLDSYLTVSGAKRDDFDFTKYPEFVIVPGYEPMFAGFVLSVKSKVNPDCKIDVYNWWGDKQFSGITFVKGESSEFLSYNEINSFVH